MNKKIVITLNICDIFSKILLIYDIKKIILNKSPIIETVLDKNKEPYL